MTTLYKLTDENWQSGLRDTPLKWGPGVTHTTSGEGDLCGPGWLHAYTSPELAVLLNPIHADFKSPVLWRAEGVVGISDHGLKVGAARLTTLEAIPLPEFTPEQRARFAIFCALEVCTDAAFVQWAENWLLGVDRIEKATTKAEMPLPVEYAARTAAYAVELGLAALAAADTAVWAAWAAIAKPLDLESLARAALTDGDRVQA